MIMVKNVLMTVLLVIGLSCMMRAKMEFQQRQMKNPDNTWSVRENKLRRIGYLILLADVVIALFIASS